MNIFTMNNTVFHCIMSHIIIWPNGPVLFCTLSSVVVCNARGRSAAAGHYTAGQYGYVPLGRHLVY